MKQTLGWTCLLGLVGLSVPMALAGQTTWDTPSFLHPGSGAGTTVAVTDYDPGDRLGLLALWRGSSAPVGIGVRGGIADAPGDRLIGLFGIDISGPLGPLEGAGRPRAMWWTGAGVRIGDRVSAAFPLGLAFGWTIGDRDVALKPYVGGHVVLSATSGLGGDTDLDGVVDLGLDLRLAPAWTVRFGAGLGGRRALGVGLTLPR